MTEIDTSTEAMAILIGKAIQFANLAAGEGISIEGLEPETFLFDYSTATGDDEWETLADRTATALQAQLAAALARAEKADGAMTQAALDVLAERARQVSAEGWDDIHDDCHDRCELALAAACYAIAGTPADEAVFIHGRWNDPRDLFWPGTWDRLWWKPEGRRRNLEKAGALILAEMERLDRAALPEAKGEK